MKWDVLEFGMNFDNSSAFVSLFSDHKLQENLEIQALFKFFIVTNLTVKRQPV